MSFLLSPKWFTLGSRRSLRSSRARDRRRSCLASVVVPLEDRQLLTTPTLISLSASASNLTFGQAEVLTATVVTNPPSPNLPTGGTVTFANGSTVLGTASLVNGSASLSTVLAAGTYSVTASYGGTTTYSSSTSATSAGYIFLDVGSGTFGNTVTVAGQPAASAQLANPFGVAVGASGTTYIADTFNNEIDYVNPSTGVIKILAGNGTFGHVDGPALSAEFASPRGLALDAPMHLLFIADRDNNVIRALDLTTGMVSTVAGTGTFGNGGSAIPATSAALGSPTAVAVSPSGLDLFIADTFNNVVRDVNLTTGIITTIAGNGTAGYTGNNGPARSAELFDPAGLAVDSAGNVFISDSDNEVVREVNASTQVITTIAGTPQSLGYSGDNGAATSAKLATPLGLALNAAGTTLYIADRDNNAIRALNLTTGIITTFAGTGPFGSSGNNGPATSATLSSPRSVAVDATGNLFIADTLGNQIRLVAGGKGTVSVTVAPYATIAPGYTTVFKGNVPTGVGNRTNQGIVLQLPATTNATAASLASSYVLSTPPNGAGKVTRFKIRRVTYDASTHVVRIFPETKLKPERVYQIVIGGQPVRPVTVVFNRAGIISESV